MLDKAFKNLKSNQYLQYLRDFFKNANKKYFENKLTLPKFQQLKNLSNPRSMGKFLFKRNDPNYLVIKLSPKLLRNKKVHDNVLLHEMCHQATYQIDKLQDEGHGHYWMQWMRKCGLPPNQYMTLEELEMLKTPLEKHIEEKEKKENSTKQDLLYYEFKTKMPCQIFYKNQWIKGLLVNPSGKNRWVFAYSNGALTVPNGDFKQVPENEKPDIIHRFEDQYNRWMREAEKRKQRREDNKNFKYTFGFFR